MRERQLRKNLHEQQLSQEIFCAPGKLGYWYGMRLGLSRTWVLMLVAALAWTEVVAARTYVVQKNDTLTDIAKRFGVSQSAIVRANNLRTPDHLVAGQRLTIPSSEAGHSLYTVKRGDTLSHIASRHGVSVSQLARLNNLSDPDDTKVGQVLLIPRAGASNSPGSLLPSSVRAQLDAVRPTPSKWRYVVIHHSGTTVGSAKGIDRYHREQRHMENGLAYHFVIGNGRGMSDGEIYVGTRWERQLDGGHLSDESLNRISIGICLIGDFQRTRPTHRQSDSLEHLVKWLMRATGVPTSRVVTHRTIQPNHTACPGRYFSLRSFRRSL